MLSKRLPFLQVAVVLVLAAIATACAHNPLSIAETPAQKAYALEASYNIVLEQAVALATAQPSIRAQIQSIEQRTTPVMNELGDAMAAYTVERAKFAAGATTEERLIVVAANLEGWIAQAERALVDLAAAIE